MTLTFDLYVGGGGNPKWILLTVFILFVHVYTVQNSDMYSNCQRSFHGWFSFWLFCEKNMDRFCYILSMHWYNSLCLKITKILVIINFENESISSNVLFTILLIVAGIKVVCIMQIKTILHTRFCQSFSHTFYMQFFSTSSG